MNIVSVGSEIVETLRIAKMIEDHGETFLRRIYTQAEIEHCSARALPTQHYAARWAAKNAVVKALGVGLHGGMSWRDVEVRAEKHGTAKVGLAGVVRDVSAAKGIQEIHVSLSSCRTMAMAVAILEREDTSQFDI